MSPNSERLLGYAAERLVGLNVLELRSLFDVEYLEPERERVELEEERARSRDDLEARVAERTARLEEANTQLRALQSRLIVAERLAAGAELTGEVAHAIRNPLAALRGTAQMLCEEAPHNPLSREIERLVGRIGDVVERTLALFQRGEVSREAHFAGAIIGDVVAQVREAADESGVEIETRIDQPHQVLAVDGPLLVEAIASLAHNGIATMRDGSGPPRRLSITVRYGPDPPRVRIEVADTGPGIPAELRERVFEPFFTTKGGGTGLGLPIARGTVLAHGGTIAIDSQGSAATTVVVTLPVA